MNIFPSLLLAYGGRRVAEGSCLGHSHALLALAELMQVLPEKAASKDKTHERALIARAGLGGLQFWGEGAGDLPSGSLVGK